MPDHNRENHNEIHEPVDHPMHARLPAYASALALGHTPGALDADIAAHLRECAECEVELDDLLEVVEPMYAGAIDPADVYPSPDLAFLAPAAKPESSWLADAGSLIIRFSQALLDPLRQPALAGAARGRLLYRYVQEPGSVADLDVAIEVYAEDSARREGRVRVSVDVPSRGPLDQTGSRVVLHADDVELQGETDESGQVDFAPVPLAAMPRLRVEITPLREF